MKLIMIAAVSSDGFIASGTHPSQDWTSPEDKAFFDQTLDQYNLFIFGSTTYEHLLPLKPRHGTLRVVVTSRPKAYFNQHKAGELEFSNQKPDKILKDLEKRGYQAGLLLGGGQIYELFYKSKLINELWISREPVFLKSGVKLFGGTTVELTKFELISKITLNEAGTTLEKYKLFS